MCSRITVLIQHHSKIRYRDGGFFYRTILFHVAPSPSDISRFSTRNLPSDLSSTSCAELLMMFT